MFRLHGHPISNFHNIAKVCLLEKGLDFQEVIQPPSQDDSFLARSPLGKIPVLEVQEGFISETTAIVEFLEDVYPEIPLFPLNPYHKELVRRLISMVVLYVDEPMRPLLRAMMGGAAIGDDRKEEIQRTLEHGLKGIARLADFSPWLFGQRFTAADVFAYYCLKMIAPIARDQLDLDVFPLLPGAAQWLDLMAERDFVRQVDDAHQAAVAKFFKR